MTKVTWQVPVVIIPVIISCGNRNGSHHIPSQYEWSISRSGGSVLMCLDTGVDLQKVTIGRGNLDLLRKVTAGRGNRSGMEEQKETLTTTGLFPRKSEKSKLSLRKKCHLHQ